MFRRIHSINRNVARLIAAGLLSILGVEGSALALKAQTPPQGVVSRTPPPAATDGIPRDGAGGYTLPSGERLVPARDPFAGDTLGGAGAALRVQAQPKITLGGGVDDQVRAVTPKGAESGQAALRMTPDIKAQLDAADAARAEQVQGPVQGVPFSGTTNPMANLEKKQDELIRAIQSTQTGARKNDGLDVDPEGALIQAQIDPRTGKPRRKASEIAQASGLVMIPAGTMLSIRSYTRVMTELGGTCIGVLEYDVWDAQMKSVAIPRGSRVLGAIQTVQGDAQARAAIIFRQIVDPNGDQLQLLVPDPATNSIGMAGIGTPDGAIINRRLGQKFGYALMWGVLGGLTGKTAASPYSNGATFSDMVKTNVASQFGAIGQQEIQSGQAIKATIEIPENTSMRVILGNPIYTRAWKRIRPF